LETLTQWTRPGRFVSGAEMVEAGLAQPIDLFAGDVWQQIARLARPT
jgi:ATP-dependent Clp protease protease subunit